MASINVSQLTDDELFSQLKSNGLTFGPITATTRRLYEKKLLKFLNPEASEVTENGESQNNNANDEEEKKEKETNSKVSKSPSKKQQPQPQAQPATPIISQQPSKETTSTPLEFKLLKDYNSQTPTVSSIKMTTTTNLTVNSPISTGDDNNRRINDNLRLRPLHTRSNINQPSPIASTEQNAASKDAATSSASSSSSLSYILIIIFMIIAGYLGYVYVLANK